MENTHLYKRSGGHRANSGRKKIPDKKEQVFAMVRQSMIDLLGEDEVKRLMTEAVVFNGQLETDNGLLKICLDADMKIVRFSLNGGPIEIAELTWTSGKLSFLYAGRIYFIADFGRVL